MDHLVLNADGAATAPSLLAANDTAPGGALPLPRSHPSCLFAVATLFGAEPVSLQRCRVLELGGANLARIDESDGQFDYIVCHGAPPEVQDRIFDVLARRLSPSGVGYVSYDTYPGRGVPRSAPSYFVEVVDKARAHGLKYVADARLSTMVANDLRPDVEATVKLLGCDRIQIEQYLDLVRHRAFRESLFVREAVRCNPEVDPDYVRTLHVASPAEPVACRASDDSMTYRWSGSPSRATTRRPILKAAMHLLRDAYPGTVAFDELPERARALIGGAPAGARQAFEDTRVLAQGLLSWAMSTELVEFYGHSIPR
jgi:hypothetical protein